MRSLLMILLLLLQIPGPHLEAHWQGNTLLVIASPGSIYLVGHDYGEQYIGQELVTLRAEGTDSRYDPTKYDTIELRDQNGNTTVLLPIPDKPPDQQQAFLPLVAKPKGTWIITLPFVAKPS